MKFLKGLGGMFGYVLGAVIILPLLLISYNYFFINKNDADIISPIYANNSINILANIPSSRLQMDKDSVSIYDFYDFKSILLKLATKNMGRSGTLYSNLEYRLVYDGVLRKYFSIMMFDLRHSGVPAMLDGFWGVVDNGKIIMRVNKSDLRNPKMGTKENPVPVFKVWGADKPLTSKYGMNKIIDYDVSDEQYRYNVMMYLTYVMPKKEFQERFEKAKK